MASVVDAIKRTFDAIDALDREVNAFTAITRERALAQAKSVETKGISGPLAGVPFAVKNLFDVKGRATLAGSKINREMPPASQDATVIARLEAAGAVLVGTLNMDEYAFGFTTENSHYGVTRNPHDRGCVAGGSSGGSAAAVAAGMVPLTLGSDTNGSIRVPAAYCGVWGLKPTYGRLSRAGTFPFVASLDHVGPIAKDSRLLAAAYDAMQGFDASDPVCDRREPQPVSDLHDIDGLRIARACGFFEENCDPRIFARIGETAEKLGVMRTVELPLAAASRAASIVITAAEGAQLHLPNVRKRPRDFDPLVIDRLRAGALVPAAWLIQAQRVRRRVWRETMKLFESVDVILAPATPVTAQRIGTDVFSVRGEQLPARPNTGMLTQPISCIGLPVICAPIGKLDGMPVGMQIIAAPWREDLCFRVARAIESLH
ncbi:MAG TPA: AtzE family amidohydrolase [Casimicrobiaceae bacterium]|nr:AtzE family amidohydrolase [Casimicrobiaceae bacterium]